MKVLIGHHDKTIVTICPECEATVFGNEKEFKLLNTHNRFGYICPNCGKSVVVEENDAMII